jgi:hypothetical protein
VKADVDDPRAEEYWCREQCETAGPLPLFPSRLSAMVFHTSRFHEFVQLRLVYVLPRSDNLGKCGCFRATVEGEIFLYQIADITLRRGAQPLGFGGQLSPRSPAEAFDLQAG